MIQQGHLQHSSRTYLSETMCCCQGRNTLDIRRIRVWRQMLCVTIHSIDEIEDNCGTDRVMFGTESQMNWSVRRGPRWTSSCIRSRSKSESGICSSAQLYLTCATFNGYKSIKKLGQVSLLQLMYTEEPLIEPPYCLSTKAHILVSVTKVWGISFSNCALVESLISLHKRN
jgi:hypothetical protein